MASSSHRTQRHMVFTSFHGPDVRKTFLSHLRKQFKCNGITMFDDDQGIARGETIGEALTTAIRESTISIVLLSKNYASSSWCLDELLEILKCEKEFKQKLMTVFYGVDPSDVRHQTGKFGIAFNKTCTGKTEEKRRKWSEAFTYISNIAGEHFRNWDNEANMIEKIASDVSNILNATPSSDLNGMVGLEAHLRELESLLDFDYDGAKIVGISGPAGIGKSTIARALSIRHSYRFPLNCFMANLKESCKLALDDFGLKLQLQEQLLSKILNQKNMRVAHLGVIKERLHNQKVLIILDDVESSDQLEALANISYFGPGSRVIVTTENTQVLQQHNVNDIYQVGFPSEREALMIFCLSAFRQTYPPDGFMNLANEVAMICCNLPLSLHILGSSLRGKSQAEWIDELPRLKSCLDGRIERVLMDGYESLDMYDKDLFLHIAIFFNHEDVDHLTSMLAKTNLDVRHGLKSLANKCLIHIDQDHGSRVVMQRYLQVMARQIISRQRHWGRQILADAHEICNVLENENGSRSNVGISFDLGKINDLAISANAFKRMRNLLFLKVYGWRPTREKQLHIPEEMEFPPGLVLIDWDAYPRKTLPLRFCPENLVELHLVRSKLEKLWEGTQALGNLKIMNLLRSTRLKEVPDLSKATKLERLDLSFCTALVELPSSFAKLPKLDYLLMNSCRSLEVIPTLINFLSHECISIIGCSRLRSFPDFPTNIMKLVITDTAVEEFPASIRHCSRLEYVDISSSRNLKNLLHLPKSITHLKLSDSGIERITDCIKGLHNLQVLDLSGCKRLVSLPELPGSLKRLMANDCDALESVCSPLNIPDAELDFTNCFKLGRQARRAIIQESFVLGWALLPGREVPVEFDHRARRNSLTIPYSAFNRFKVCVVISPNRHQFTEFIVSELLYRCIVIGNSVNSVDMKFTLSDVSRFRKAHLFVFQAGLSFTDPSEVSREIVVQFSTRDKVFKIIECGIQILTDETDGSNNGSSGDEDEGNDYLDTHASSKASEREEDSDSIADGRSISESDEASDKEDGE